MNKNKRKSNHNYSCTKYVEGRANKRTSTGCKQIEELPDLVENHNQSVKSHPSTTKYSHQPTTLHYISVEKQKSKVRRQDNSNFTPARSKHSGIATAGPRPITSGSTPLPQI